jgi:hypothetical protein
MPTPGDDDMQHRKRPIDLPVPRSFERRNRVAF